MGGGVVTRMRLSELHNNFKIFLNPNPPRVQEGGFPATFCTELFIRGLPIRPVRHAVRLSCLPLFEKSSDPYHPTVHGRLFVVLDHCRVWCQVRPVLPQEPGGSRDEVLRLRARARAPPGRSKDGFKWIQHSGYSEVMCNEDRKEGEMGRGANRGW